VSRTKAGKRITNGDLNRKIVRHEWGEHAMVVGYGMVGEAPGNALART
jgi:hypothetical protein